MRNALIADVDPVPKRTERVGWIQLIERQGPRGWSIMIMPHEIRIDSFHGPPHIHPPRNHGGPVPIPDRSMDAVRETIRLHVGRRRTIVYDELVEELR